MLAPGGTTALQYSRKGGRFVPASTDSLLSVTLVSLQQEWQPRQASACYETVLMQP